MTNGGRVRYGWLSIIACAFLSGMITRSSSSFTKAIGSNLSEARSAWYARRLL